MPPKSTRGPASEYKVVLNLHRPLDNSSYSNGISHFFVPGEKICGEVIVNPKISNPTLKFNEVNITFEGKLFNRVQSETPIELFSMTVTHEQDTILNEERKYEYKFKIPERITGLCPENDSLHIITPPSFGSASLCSEYFSDHDDPKTMKFTKDSQFDTFKTLAITKLGIVYSIMAEVIDKKESGSNEKLFVRAVEIPLRSILDPIPPNSLESECNIFHHYGINEETEQGDLIVKKTMLLEGKSKNDQPLGHLTGAMMVPPPVAVNAFDTSLPLKLIFKKLSGSMDIDLLSIAYSAELCQYTIQTEHCSFPSANPKSLPDNNFMVDFNTDNRKVTQKIRTLKCEIQKPFNDEWLPTYEDKDSKSQRVHVIIPRAPKADFQAGFHTCSLQNIYVLRVHVSVKPKKTKLLSKISFSSDLQTNRLRLDIPINLVP